jgi:hypothetical protein
MGKRMIIGMLFGLPASVASLLLIAMLLELCDRVVGPGARLRLTLEALTVASGIYVPLWNFVLRPSKPPYMSLQGACVPVMVASALCCVVLGLAAVVLVRSHVARRTSSPAACLPPCSPSV